jgi:hypothetical protein
MLKLINPILVKESRQMEDLVNAKAYRNDYYQTASLYYGCIKALIFLYFNQMPQHVKH